MARKRGTIHRLNVHRKNTGSIAVDRFNRLLYFRAPSDMHLQLGDKVEYELEDAPYLADGVKAVVKRKI